MSRAADRNLLFGILALQMDFVSRDALIAGMHAWVLEKAKPLGHILRDQGQLSGERLQLLDALVEEHVRAHGDDAQQSLAALSSISSVKQSLQAIDDPELHFSLGVVGAKAAPRDPSTTDDVPQAGPRFRILRPHAKGGLGAISVAEDQELHREVALKEIQERHADDPHSRGRFLLEAEITGGLEHPGIVPVYSLGAYADGRPFYAMRFIKGDNLMEAIQRFHEADQPGRDPGQRSLAFRQLLGRFVDVCQAVAYAHSRGVLHRDLKPGNIMLGKYGETLVVDWGLAKAVGRTLTEKDGEERTLRPSSGSQPGLTQAGSAVGTPAYMSPEQAAGRLDELGPASDVYSLGATLYTLLTGQAAFRRQEDVGATLQQVQQGEFPKPRAVKKDVPTALEAVCLKAMALRQEDRYSTALTLAAEVEHWLADEPVSAYREPWSVSTRRWARQHPRLVTGLAATLLIGVVGLAVGLAAVERERARTAQERDDKDNALAAEQKARAAETEARDQALAALRAMTDDVVENQLARGTQLTDEDKEFLRKIIKHFEGFAAITADDTESRAIRAEGYHRVGLMRYRLGELQDAETAYGTALALQKQLAADFPTRPEFRQDLARSHHNLGLLLSATGRLPEAETACGAALALQKQLAADFPTRPEFRRVLAISHNSLGNLLHTTGRLPEAETAHGAALALRKQLAADFPTRPEFRKELAASHNNLGALLHTTGRLPEAETAFGAALALQKQLAADFPTRPEFRQELAISHNNLGNLLRDTGRLPEAETAYGAALALQKQLAADFPTRPEFRQELAISHNNLGNLLRDTGRLPEAVTAFGAALALQKQLAADFPTRPEFRQDLARSHHNLGVLFRATDRLPDAETAFGAALALFKQLAADFPTRPEFRQNLALVHHNLGVLLHTTGRLPEAETAYGAALALQKQLAADFPNQPDLRNDLANTFSNLALLCNRRRDFQAARAYLDEARPHHQAALKANPRHPTYQQFYRNNLRTLARANAGLLDQAGAVRAAETIRDLGWDPPGNAYDAACALALCTPIVAKHEQLDAGQRPAAVQFYDDQALALLRDAVAKGFKDVAKMKKDTALAPLRPRADFQKLLAELEGKEAEKK